MKPPGHSGSVMQPGVYKLLNSEFRARPKRLLCMRQSNTLLWGLVATFMAYMVLGAVVFTVLEDPYDAAIRQKLRKIRGTFLRQHPCISDDELESFIAEIVEASRYSVSALNNVSSDTNWSFGKSLFFSGTVITTIGYGNVAPLSKGGKVFCIVYALIGIPMTLMLLKALVERLLIVATLFLQFLNSRLGHLYQPFNIRVFHLSIVGGLIIIIFFLVPAAIFSCLEPEWDYVDSIYYCFISLTTIGLGDYVPGDSPGQRYRALYKVCTTGYLLVGLTFMMLFLSILYDIPQLNFGLFFLLKSDEMTSDPEKVRLPAGIGPKYTQQIDEPTVRHVRAMPHPPSSSPEDANP